MRQRQQPRSALAQPAHDSARAPCSPLQLRRCRRLWTLPHPGPAGRTVETVRADVHWLMQRFNGSSALLRVEGRPVYFVYDHYRLPPDQWAHMLTPGGEASVRGTELDGASAARAPGRMRSTLANAACVHAWMQARATAASMNVRMHHARAAHCPCRVQASTSGWRWSAATWRPSRPAALTDCTRARALARQPCLPASDVAEEAGLTMACLGAVPRCLLPAATLHLMQSRLQAGQTAGPTWRSERRQRNMLKCWSCLQ